MNLLWYFFGGPAGPWVIHDSDHTHASDNVVLAGVARDYTSVAAGNWSTPTNWTPEGVPGDTDTAVVAHDMVVNQNTIVGRSGALNSVAVTINAGKTLTINAGVRLTVRGDVANNKGTLVLNAGGKFRFDSSAASGTPIYKIVQADVTSSEASRIIANGTAQDRCTIDVAVGSGVGVIRQTSSTAGCSGLKATYTDFVQIGDASNSNWVRPNDANHEFTLDHCTLDRCGTFYMYWIAAAAHNTIKFCSLVAPPTLSTFTQFQLGAAAGGSGARVFEDNALYTPLANYGAVYFEYEKSGWSVKRNLCNAMAQDAGSAMAGVMTWEGNLVISRGNTGWSFVGWPTDTVLDQYYIYDKASGYVGLMPCDAPYKSGTITYDGLVTENSEFTHLPSPQSGYTSTYVLKNSLCLPGPAGTNTTGLRGRGNIRQSVQFEHNTVYLSGGNAMGIGDAFAGFAGMYKTCKSNLVFADSTPVSGGYVFSFANSTTCYRSGPVAAIASGSDTTHIAVASSIFLTNEGERYSQSGAVAVIIAKGAGGPAIGESSVISGQTATILTLATPLSASPDADTRFIIATPELFAEAADVDYNATFNLNNGLCYGPTGATSTSFARRGYNELWTEHSNFAAHDITLSTSPGFADPTRRFATAHISCFGQAVGTAWTSGATYAAGDIVSSATTGIYGGATVNYRCVAGHTALTGDADRGKPNVAANYRSYWEYATASYVAADTSRIAVMRNWVKAGFSPSNVALQNAGHDGATIGAMGFAVTLAIADSNHRHAQDVPALVYTQVFSDDAEGGHDSDPISLGTVGILGITDSNHLHGSDGITLGVLLVLNTADSNHLHASDGIVLVPLSPGTLAVYDSDHSHASDNLTLTHVGALVVARSEHLHASDLIRLRDPNATYPGAIQIRDYYPPYQRGDMVILAGQWVDPATEDLAAADPTEVHCVVRTPRGAKIDYEYGVETDLRRTGTGEFSLQVNLDQHGVWYYRWYSVGLLQASEERSFEVAKNNA